MRVGSFRRGEKAGLHYVDFSEGDKHEEPMMTFCELGQELMPEKFLRSQRELREAAKLRAMVTKAEKQSEVRRDRKLTKKALRQRLKKRLWHKKKKARMSLFMDEVTRRSKQGYSAAQLLRSHVPEVGAELKVTEAEVNAALKIEEHFPRFLGSPCLRFSFQVFDSPASFLLQHFQ